MPTTAPPEPVGGRPAVGSADGVAEDLDWSDLDAIGNLRIADFACGTGALLSAVAEQITSRYERTGGNVTKVHPILMEQVLYGCDVMPSAVHITGSTLAGLQPSVSFQSSNLTTMPYGRQDDGSVAIGSLELLNPDSPFSQTMPDESFDLVIMNRLSTRNTTNEGEYSGEFNAAFAAFGTGDETQRAMGRRMTSLTRGTSYHGNAGIASAFATLAHRRLKPGGVLALVLPLSAATGLSWEKFRALVAERYDDIWVVSIAADGVEMSFSSDTGMAECLVVARKQGANVSPNRRISYATLQDRPRALVVSHCLTNCVHGLIAVRRIEDGPYGGTILQGGHDTFGETLTTPAVTNGAKWEGVRVRDYSLAQTAQALAHSILWLPTVPSTKLPIGRLADFAKVGLHHRDITGPAPRGPFDKVALSPGATYPALWNHDALNESRFVCEPDCELRVRIGMEGKAIALWDVASRSHVSLEFRFNSQPIAVAFTDRPTMGGRAWPNVKFRGAAFDHVFGVWANSTLGLLSYWWHSNLQVSRARCDE